MLILIRHGRTALNAAGRLQGRIDEPLDEIGRQQAKAVADRVGEVDLLISSPLQRATETAEAFGMPFTTDERWIELSYGVFEGAPIAGTPAEVWQHWREDAEYEPPEGESLAELFARVRQTCDELAGVARESRVAVVTHVSPIKSAVAWALDASVAISWRSHLSLASVCRIDLRSGAPVLTAFNETVDVPD